MLTDRFFIRLFLVGLELLVFGCSARRQVQVARGGPRYQGAGGGSRAIDTVRVFRFSEAKSGRNGKQCVNPLGALPFHTVPS